MNFRRFVVSDGKSPQIRTYQNKNLAAVFPKLCTLQIRTCFSLMKDRFLLQGVAKLIFDCRYVVHFHTNWLLKFDSLPQSVITEM